MSHFLKTQWSRFIDWFTCWLTCDIEPLNSPTRFDFNRLRAQIKPADVLLVAGKSRVSRVITTITKSAWTHAALYIGSLNDIEEMSLKEKIAAFYQGDPDEPLIVESLMGQGVVITPLSRYQPYHIRICRPIGLPLEDAKQVVAFTLPRLGQQYDNRQIFDLARFLLPWSILPRRWRSSLFAYHASSSTKLTCSLLIAEAFMSIRFPILPLVRSHTIKGYEFIKRNPKLFTPKDFDYSPYFQILKYPIVEFSDDIPYTSASWNEEELVSNDEEGLYIPKKITSPDAKDKDHD
ncbi:TPA: YiiX/YebB-like N1pC/P60 family cysteine hydrolase [Legionella anisa]